VLRGKRRVGMSRSMCSGFLSLHGKPHFGLWYAGNIQLECKGRAVNQPAGLVRHGCRSRCGSMAAGASPVWSTHHTSAAGAGRSERRSHGRI
jgi:hypothetical protein